MTVASKLKQTLASLKNVEATLQNYTIYHPDPETKEEFKACGEKIKQIIAGLETRVQELEFEEPQYRGF